LPERLKQRVLLVTADNLYLEGALLVYDNIQVDKLTPDEYLATDPATLSDYHAIVFDDVTPSPDHLPPSGHLLYFHPQGEHSPFAITGQLSRPRITEINENHPVMRWLVMDDVNFDTASVFAVDRGTSSVALARSIRSPIIAARRDGRRKIVACGFALTGTDLMLRVAFPLLLVNTLDWFAGDDSDLITTYATGRRIRVPMDGTFELSEVQVETPSGRSVRAPLAEGVASFYASEVGVHRLTARAPDGQAVASIQLAANLANPQESDIAPSTELNMGGRRVEPPAGFHISHRRSLWLYLTLLVLLLLAAEWVTYNRRITV
jgi:hypothetical protein